MRGQQMRASLLIITGVQVQVFLDLPRDVICSMARFRLHAYTLQVETVT